MRESIVRKSHGAAASRLAKFWIAVGAMTLFCGCSAISTQEQKDRLEQERLSLLEERNRLQGALAQSEGLQRAATGRVRELEAELRQAGADYDELERRYQEQLTTRTPTDEDLERFRGVEGVRADRQGQDVRLTVDQAILFAPGATDVTATGKQILQKVAQILQQNYSDDRIRVEGHTDNTPVKRVKDRFPTNWELSVARACAVLRVLLQYQAVAPERSSAVGHGEYRPVASNDTESGRAANRRVEIYVSPN